MDLSRVREELGGEMEIYIINASGVIEETTYPPDLGLDFRGIPYFYDRITEIRLGDAFVADRVVAEISTGKLRKYAYMPSPDHRYVFELGLAEPGFREDRTALRYGDAVRELVNLDPAIREIRIFDCLGTLISGEARPDDDRRLEMVRQAYREKTTLEVENATADELVRYIFVDMADSSYPSDMSLVVELTYSTTVAETKLAGMLGQHMNVLLIAILCIGSLSVLAARSLTRPIRTLVEDVDAVARGDLDHRIRVSPGTELTRLSESIGTMVASLKENIQRLRASEATSRQYGTHLEDQVRARTAELEASNQTAALYLDIMVHDINNANTIAIGYTQFLADALDGEQQRMAQKMLSQLRRSSALIASVATLRRAPESLAELAEVDLDQVIRAQVAEHSVIPIRYEGRPVRVLANDLLSAVFENLIGNAEKFAGLKGEITIRVEDHGDEVLVSVEDTGPGIPDDIKPHLFARFSGGNGEKSGRGLGLYICRMLVERYGGRIWVDDRVPGRPECGSALRFTLRKAPGE